MLPIIFDGLDSPGVIIIPGNEDGNIIIVFEIMGYHIGSQLYIGAFLVGRNAGPVGINQASQSQLGIGYRVDSIEKSLLLFIKIGLLFLPYFSVIIIDSY